MCSPVRTKQASRRDAGCGNKPVAVKLIDRTLIAILAKLSTPRDDNFIIAVIE
jgi:hypothetical protein